MRRTESAAVIVVLALLLALTALDLGGHRLFVVTGASMEPSIARGSLVVARATLPASLAVGDVVTFQHKGATVTHRIAAIDEYGDARIFTTKGDANDSPDPDAVSFDGEVGVVETHLPLVGYIVALVQAYGRLASLAVGLILAAWAVRRARTRSRARPFPLRVTA